MKDYNKAMELNKLPDDILNYLPDAAFAIDKTGKVIAWNKAMEVMTGVKSTSIIGKDNFEYSIPFYGERRPLLVDLIFKTVDEISEFNYTNIKKEGQDLIAETTIPDLNGKECHLWVKASPINNDEGKLMGVVETIRDITGYKKAEDALIISKNQFQSIFDHAPVGIFHTSPEGKVYEVNQKLVEMLKYSSIEEFITTINQKTLQESVYVNEEDRSRWVNEVLSDDKWHSCEISLYKKTGEQIIVNLSARSVKGQEGDLKYLEGFLEDITERKEMLEKLHRSEKRFRALAESAVDAILTTDKQGNIILFNNSLLGIFGYTRREILHKPVSLLIPHRLRKKFLQRLSKFQSTGRHSLSGRTFLSTGLRKNGTEFPFEMSLATWESEGEKFNTSIIRDVTERKEAEEALKENEEKYRAMMDYSSDAILLAEFDGTILECNKMAEKLLGYSADEILHLNIKDIHPIKEEELIQISFKKAITGTMGIVETLVLTKDKREVPVAISGSLIEYGDKKVLQGIFRDITARKEAEKRLRESQNKLKIAMDLAQLVHWEYDVKADLFEFDDQFYSLYGTSTDEMGGAKMSSADYAKKFIPTEWVDIVAQETRKAIETHDPDFKGYAEHPIIRADGEKRYLVVRFGVVKDENGETIRTYGANQDITERVSFEKALIESEERFHQTAENTGVWIWEIDAKGKYTYSNNVVEEILGYKTNEIVGIKHIYDSIPPEERKEVKKTLHQYIERKKPFKGLKHRRLHKDGSIVVLETNGVPHIDNGEYLGYRGVDTDITQREQAALALRESEKKFRDLTELLPQTVFETDLKGNFTFANQVAYETFGYKPEDLEKGLNLLEMLVPEDRKRAMENVQTVLSGKKLGALEYTAIKKDGNFIPILTYTDSILEDNKPIGLRGVLLDLTEYKRAEEELKRTETKYQDLYSSMKEGMAIHEMVYDSQGEAVDYMMTDVNPAFEEIIGLKRSEVIGKKASEIYQVENPPYMDVYAKVAREGKPVDFETYFEPMNKHFRVSVNSPEKGRFATIFEDITLRKKAEDEIKASLKEKELLLQEIHHRVKNNLQIISSLLNLQESYVDDAEAIGVLQESQNRVLSMAMIHEMLYDSEDLSTINFFGYIQNLVYDLFNTYRIKNSHLTLNLNVDEILLNIETAVPCGLITSELVSNSLKYAFPEEREGNLSIEFHQLLNGKYQLIIEDDGVGLPSDIDFKNTDSLGLRLVSSLVNQLDGTIELDRSQGTKFIILFNELKYKKRI
jgi:PAS domain S-box-containing protein